MAAILSVIPLGLGFWWALWDPWRQTWHDKIMHTYVLRDTEELASRRGSSSTVAKVLFWVLVAGPFILGILAAVIIPNVGRFLGSGESDAPYTEFQNVTITTSTMMVDNNIFSIPHPFIGTRPPCARGTNDLSRFPDSISRAGGADKATDFFGNPFTRSDGDGYVLYAHDIEADGRPSPTVNYMSVRTSAFCYTVDRDGTVIQYDTAGNRINP